MAPQRTKLDIFASFVIMEKSHVPIVIQGLFVNVAKIQAKWSVITVMVLRQIVLDNFVWFAVMERLCVLDVVEEQLLKGESEYGM